MEKEFEELVKSATSIVVTSHFSPDPDALASALLLAETLRVNFPATSVHAVLEEQPAQNLNFLNHYDGIIFAPLADQLQTLKPDLIIIVDTYTFDRVSRQQADDIRTYIRNSRATVAVIDHHEVIDTEADALMLNRHAPAAAQEVYHVCFEALNLKKPEGYQDMAMLGILTDTAHFRYPHPLMRETFAIAGDLLAAGANIQALEDKLERYSDSQIKVLSHLAANTQHDADYSYAFIDDDFYAAYLKQGGTYTDMKSMVGLYVDEFIRKIADRRWGFAVYPDPQTPEMYKASFRAITGAKNVLAIATALNGGGHIPAAAAAVAGKDVQAAIETVKRTIKEVG